MQTAIASRSVEALLKDAISARRRPVQKADVIIYAVSPASSLDAAKSVKPQLPDAPYLPDLNSASPAASRTRRRQREMGQIGKEVRRALGERRAAILNAISAAARDRN
jgi:prephenate dehydrogenase